MGQAGFSLLEVVIAIGLIALVSLALFTAIAFSSRHTLNADIKSTAESIARSEMEYIKTLPYDSTHNPPQYTPATMASLGMGTQWTVTVSCARLHPKHDGTAADDGIQIISVTVLNKGVIILTVEGYKLH